MGGNSLALFLSMGERFPFDGQKFLELRPDRSSRSFMRPWGLLGRKFMPYYFKCA